LTIASAIFTLDLYTRSLHSISAATLEADMKKVPRPIRLPLPGIKRPIGLGQAIKAVTSAVGITPCGGCGRRALILDSRVQLTPTRKSR
jgi:hypothetical protein